MAKPTAQQCHALTTYFVDAYTGVVGKKPVVNRNKARWGFESLLMDYDPVESRELIDFYVKHWNTPSLEWFLFNYEKVISARDEARAKERSSERRREETRARLENWRKRFGNE